MARPHKAGIDYFPLDTSFDDSIELLKLEFGSRAVGVLVGLYQKIYSTGYYTSWNKDILMLFARSACEGKDLIEQVLERALEREIFDQELFETHGIITSCEIQLEYLRICRQSKRKQIVMIKDYCLVNDSDLLGAVTEMQTLAGCIDDSMEEGNLALAQPASDEKEIKNPTEGDSMTDSSDPAVEITQNAEPNDSPVGQNPALRTALRLRDRIRDNNPRAKIPGDEKQDPTLAEWVRELELMHRKGPYGAKVSENRGYSWKEIIALIDYSQSDSFWAAHILCPLTLRKKAITLETKMRRSIADENRNTAERTKSDMAGKYRKFVG